MRPAHGSGGGRGVSSTETHVVRDMPRAGVVCRCRRSDMVPPVNEAGRVELGALGKPPRRQGSVGWARMEASGE
jgi:hypothetical protein